MDKKVIQQVTTFIISFLMPSLPKWVLSFNLVSFVLIQNHSNREDLYLFRNDCYKLVLLLIPTFANWRKEENCVLFLLTYCFLIFIFKSTYFKGRFEQFLKSCLLSIFFKSKNSKFVKQNDFVFFFLDVETLRKID